MSEDYIKLLVGKIDRIQDGVSDVEKRVAIIDQKFEDHEDYTQRILADISRLQGDLAELRGQVKAVQAVNGEVTARVVALEELKSNATFLTKAVPYIISAGGAILGAIAAYYGLKG